MWNASSRDERMGEELQDVNHDRSRQRCCSSASLRELFRSWFQIWPRICIYCHRRKAMPHWDMDHKIAAMLRTSWTPDMFKP